MMFRCGGKRGKGEGTTVGWIDVLVFYYLHSSQHYSYPPPCGYVAAPRRKKSLLTNSFLISFFLVEKRKSKSIRPHSINCLLAHTAQGHSVKSSTSAPSTVDQSVDSPFMDHCINIKQSWFEVVTTVDENCLMERILNLISPC